MYKTRLIGVAEIDVFSVDLSLRFTGHSVTYYCLVFFVRFVAFVTFAIILHTVLTVAPVSNHTAFYTVVDPILRHRLRLPTRLNVLRRFDSVVDVLERHPLLA